jgi:hypothetical protein
MKRVLFSKPSWFSVNIILLLSISLTPKLYAQESILFEHIWYLEKVFDGVDEFYIADYTNYEATTEFFETENYIYVKLCGFDWFTGTPEYLPNSGFTLSDFEYNVFAKDCGELHYNLDFPFIREKMFTVFFEWPEPVIFFNPFTYSFTQSGNDFFLVIENADGKKAYYNSFPLSIADRQENNFVVYPNPVTNMLFVKSLVGDGLHTAKIHNIPGAVVTETNLGSDTTEISLENLVPGIYFLTIENESGMGITKKIIKK